MDLLERIQQLEALRKADRRRIAELETLVKPKKDAQPRKRKSNYVPKIKGRIKSKADAHAYIEDRFAKRKLKPAA